MFAKIASFITASKVAEQNKARQKQFLNWENIFIVALIIDDKETINKSELDKFIEGLKKYTEVFFVELNSKQAAYGDWKCVTKKDKTVLNLPKDFFLQESKAKKYDVIINVSNRYSLFTANLTARLNAPFKCGNADLYGELDLIIERKESQSLIAYLKEVVKYLEMIKTA